MNKNPHAVALGKLSGKVSSAARAEASRINGRKGGRKKLPLRDSIACIIDGQKCLKSPLSNGHFAIIDECDAYITQYRWNIRIDGKNMYATRNISIDGKKTRETMHRRIMNFPRDFDTDHANGDGLDNRRCNLRVCSRSQNNINQHNQRHRESLYKGVYRCRNNTSWAAKFSNKHLGTFRTELEAAKGYDAYVLKHFSEFAQPNFKHA